MGFRTFLYLIFMKEINITEPLTCFNLQIICFKFLGTWPPDTDNKIILKLYSIYSFVTRILFVHLFIFSKFMFIRNAKDVQAIADGTFILTTVLSLGYKVTNFNMKYKRIRTILYNIDIELFHVKDLTEAKFLEMAMKRTFLVFIIFLLAATMTIIGLIIIPFFDSDELHLPLPTAWFPFDINSSAIMFSTIYIYQVFGLMYCAWFSVASDTFMIGLISIMDAHIKILGHRFEQMGFLEKQYENQSMIDKNMMVEYNRSNVYENKENYFYKIVKCIINHNEILRYIREFEMIFREVIFAQLVLSVILVCMTALILINTIPGSMKFFTMMLYLVCAIFQIFIYCWTGNEITYSSTQLTDKAYFCNFHIFDKRTKKVLILFMQRSTLDIKIITGRVFRIALSLGNFVGIIKTSYTYLAVLRNIQIGKTFR